MGVLRHMREKHIDICSPQEIISRDDYCSFMTTNESFIKKCHCELISFVITSYSPFSIVENNHFLNFIQLLNPSYIPPSRTTLSERIIPAYAQRAKNLIRKEISSASNICCTLDGWTTSNFNCQFFLLHVILFQTKNLKVLF